ncbi:cyclophilin-like fold protein [Sphingobacterium faecium]|uniref:cyclophilin-like fold protein n=1 Tax=Sphingobacterium faecium TaxID=34087 RepID=UPI0032082C0F
MSATHMKITIGKAVFTATLYDNPSAHAFTAMLPLTIDMNELNGNEKYDDVPNTLPAKPAGSKAYFNDLFCLYFEL